MLLTSGAAVECSGDSKPWTPLQLALKIGANSVVRILLENGADPEAVDKQGNSPIHQAISLNQVLDNIETCEKFQ